MLTDLAFYLASENVDVRIVTSNQLYTDSKHCMASLENKDSVTIRRIWTTRFGRGNLIGRAIDYLTFYASATFVLLKECKTADWLVLKTDPPMMSVIGAFLKGCRSFKMVAWCQDVFPEIALPNRLLVSVRNWSLNRADRVIVLGDDMRKFLESQVEDSAKVVVLPNWADGEQIVPVQARDNSLRAEWGLDENVVLGYSGNLGRVHEYKTMLQAMELLTAGGAYSTQRLKMLFIGSGALHKRLQDELPDTLNEVTLFKPYQPREALKESLGVPDIHWFSLAPDFRDLVFPSKFYGILAAGRPVIFIGDTQSELAKLIEDEGLGFACGPGDVALTAERLRYLVEHESERLAMGERARVYFDQHCEFKKVAEQWREFLTVE